MNLKLKIIFGIVLIAVLPVIAYIAALKTGINFIFIWSVIAIIFSIYVWIYAVKNLLHPVNSIIKLLKGMGEGNFSYDINCKSNSSNLGSLYCLIGNVCKVVRELVGNLENGVERLYNSGTELDNVTKSSASIATEVARAVEMLASGSSDQVEDVANVTGNISKATSTSHQIKTEITSINKIANEFVNIAVEGKKDIESTLDKVNTIKEKSIEVTKQITQLGSMGKDIGEIVDIITGISKQTNLLALNAAIEAARAGEHGKGFAVVADEVKKLADKSSSAASEIKAMIAKVQLESENAVVTTNVSLEKVEEGVESFNALKENFEKIFEQAKIINNESSSISKSVSELINLNDFILNSITSVSSVTETNAAAAEQISASTQEHSAGTQVLERQSEDILKLARTITVNASIFKIDTKPEIFFWSKKFFTGVEEIDYQHYKIVNYVNTLYQMFLNKENPAVMAKYLGELGAFAIKHFETEEVLFEKYKYPKIDDHKYQHKKLVDTFLQFVEKLNSNNAKIDEPFIEFLNKWLREHILQQDMQYAPFFKSKGLS